VIDELVSFMKSAEVCMSTEERLMRLGLLPLKDNPNKLKEVLQARLSERRKLELEWQRKREQLLKTRRPKKQAPLVADFETTHQPVTK